MVDPSDVTRVAAAVVEALDARVVQPCARLVDEVKHGENPATLTRQRVALFAQERVPVREPDVLENLDGQHIGQVTSGLLSPTLNQPIALAYVQPDYAALGTELFAIVRVKPVPMVVAPTPFVPTRYYRG